MGLTGPARDNSRTLSASVPAAAAAPAQVSNQDTLAAAVSPKLACDLPVWNLGAEPYQPRDPLRTATRCDIAVIGGGFTGVSAAYHLAEAFPQKRIVLIEGNELASAQSGKSSGQLLHGITHDTKDEVLARRIWEATDRGIQIPLELIQKHGLNVRCNEGATVKVAHSSSSAAKAEAEVEFERKIGIPVRYVSGSDLKHFIDYRGAVGGIVDPHSAVINGTDFLHAMRAVLERMGVEVYEQTPVRNIQQGRTVSLITDGGGVKCDALVLGTAAGTAKLGFFGDRLVRIKSAIAATGALDDSQALLGGAIGFNDLTLLTSYGSRTSDGRMTFGGGGFNAYRFLGRDEDGDHIDQGRDAQLAFLRKHYHRTFSADRAYEFRNYWAGVVDWTLDGVPSIGRTGTAGNIFYGVGYSGHGLALASLSGEIIRDLYAGDAARWNGLPFFQKKLAYAGPAWLRAGLYRGVAGILD